MEVDHSVPQSKNLLEAQRHEKCRTDVDSCKAEGNGSNAQRMERTVEKKKDAVKLVKAGRQVGPLLAANGGPGVKFGS